MKQLSLLCFLLLAGCSHLSSNIIAADDPVTGPNTLSQTVDQLAVPLVASGDHVGIVVGVQDMSGRRHVFGYGRTSLQSDEKPDGKTIFGIGSLTKSFSSLIYYKLVKQGVLHPDDNVGMLLPDQTGFSEAAKHITLHQLADHVSGLPRQPNDLRMLGNLIHYSFTGDDIYSHIDRARVFDFLKTFDPAPDEVGQYLYSNIGMGLFGTMIEVKTGQSLDMLLQRQLSVPLGLHNTFYDIPSDAQGRLASGYAGDSPCFLPRNTPIDPWRMSDIFKGAAGLYSSADDLLKLANYRMTLHDIPVETFPAAQSWGSTGPASQQVSMGWEVDPFPEGTILYQRGMIAGYSAYMGIVPSKNLAVVVLYNNFDWDDQIGHNLILTLLRQSNHLDLNH